MKRNVISSLLKWKNKPKRKPLVVTGVRQCGKTFILKSFGAEHFEDTAYFNFEETESLSSLFEHDFNVERILDELGSIVLGREIVPGKTLVIFDEIQTCPRAITALKYFCENLPELHVIAAGSLLGVALAGISEGFSFPVGKVDRLMMYPMTFDEFVQADGGENLIKSGAKFDLNRELPEIYTSQMEKYLKLYYIIGGMPEAVQTWCDTHSFEEVEKVQQNILRDYADDFAKHAPIAEVPRIRLIWQSVPVQLAKENNKFVFSHVREGARSKELEDSLEWLINSSLVYKLPLVENPEQPLSFMANEAHFKIYMADVGLLRKRSGIYYKMILDGGDDFIRFKGALTENFVMSELRAAGFFPYFWRSGNTAELDFLLEAGGKIIPIEVKSSENTRAKSLRLFCTKHKPALAVKFSLKNVGCTEENGTRIQSLPLYQIFRLKDYLN
ncbi:AAA family ATPase [Treponema sp. UBA3813]|uniref:ATP-binding protein n=1 Tax=Treponema sp. UBA3813 TaxID=1947715 RepID=UPI0025E1409E|nr:AAA family ATPase [Treponema sp. UBA3813]